MGHWQTAKNQIRHYKLACDQGLHCLPKYVNPLYNDILYSNKILYYVNFIGTKLSIYNSKFSLTSKFWGTNCIAVKGSTVLNILKDKFVKKKKRIDTPYIGNRPVQRTWNKNPFAIQSVIQRQQHKLRHKQIGDIASDCFLFINI